MTFEAANMKYAGNAVRVQVFVASLVEYSILKQLRLKANFAAKQRIFLYEISQCENL